jgi:membrane fusion protein (multidrug efflux system)
MMNIRAAQPALLALLLLAAACGQQDKPGNESESDGEDNPPVPVETAMPVRGDVNAIFRGTAPIEAYAEADVIARVAGEVREILVEEGDEVNEGDVLARLDGDRLRLELEATEARLRKLERDFQRNVDLNEKGLISAGDFEKIKYEMEALRASRNLAALELGYTQIRAPIAGVVSRRYIKRGNTLAVDGPAFRITSTDPLVIELHVPEREFARLAPGQPVSLDIDALRTGPVLASVTRVSPVIDAETGTFKVTIELHDPERHIKPGMFARVSVVYDSRENALLVPRNAVIDDNGSTSVFVVEENKARRRPVETGYGSDGMVEILAGLDDGERVITVGQIGLKADAVVTVIDDDQSDASGLADDADGDNLETANAATN